MQDHLGGAGGVGQDLDVAPVDTPDAGAERLRYRLLGGEPAGQLRAAASAVGLLGVGVDTVQKALAEAFGGADDALDLDDVDPQGAAGAAVQKRPVPR